MPTPTMLNPTAMPPTPAHCYRAENETAWTATGHERPVFLDERGRRRRWVLLGGAMTGGASALWFAALVAGAIGFSTLPSLRTASPLAARQAARGLALVGAQGRPIVAHRSLIAHRPALFAHGPAIVAHHPVIVAQQRRQATSTALLVRPAAGREAIRGE